MTMTRITLRGALALACLLAPFAVRAEADLSTFNAFGGKEGLAKVADLGIDNVLKDKRISARFVGANIPRLKAMLAVQFCALLDGPCQYTGKDMQAAHAGMNLHDAEFNALAEDFQLAMDEAGVPFRVQNRLLAKLAPMEKAMVK